MREKLFIELWNRAKSTYPAGTSKHMSALLEEDFDSFLDEVVKICAIPAVVGRSEQLKCMMKHTDGNCDCGIGNCIEGGW